MQSWLFLVLSYSPECKEREGRALLCNHPHKSTLLKRKAGRTSEYNTSKHLIYCISPLITLPGKHILFQEVLNWSLHLEGQCGTRLLLKLLKRYIVPRGGWKRPFPLQWRSYRYLYSQHFHANIWFLKAISQFEILTATISSKSTTWNHIFKVFFFIKIKFFKIAWRCFNLLRVQNRLVRSGFKRNPKIPGSRLCSLGHTRNTSRPLWQVLSD